MNMNLMIVKLMQKHEKFLLNNIRRRLTPQAVKCRADVEVACYGYEGVDAVKAALREGLNASTEEMPVKINLIAPPLYVVTATCLDREEGLQALRNVIEKIKQGIEQYRGIFKIKMEPKVVTDVDDATLKDAMQRAEDENRERSGDDNEDSDEDEDGGIKGTLPGEDEDETTGAVGISVETKKSSQNNTKPDEDDDKEVDDDNDDD